MAYSRFLFAANAALQHRIRLFVLCLPAINLLAMPVLHRHEQPPDSCARLTTGSCPLDAIRNLFVPHMQQSEQRRMRSLRYFYLEAASVSRNVCALLASNGPSTRASTSPWRLNTTA